MKNIKFDELLVALDMSGCSNRCKHFWIGHSPNKKCFHRDIEYVAQVFSKFSDKMTINSWHREPDYRDDYK